MIMAGERFPDGLELIGIFPRAIALLDIPANGEIIRARSGYAVLNPTRKLDQQIVNSTAGAAVIRCHWQVQIATAAGRCGYRNAVA